LNNSSNNISSSIRNNHKRGRVGYFLKEQVDKGSQQSIISAFFTIYAYKKLKNKLDSIKSINSLFGEPTFIKDADLANINRKEFKNG